MDMLPSLRLYPKPRDRRPTRALLSEWCGLGMFDQVGLRDINHGGYVYKVGTIVGQAHDGAFYVMWRHGYPTFVPNDQRLVKLQ